MAGPSPHADTAAHASTQNVLRRAQMPQPEYRALAARLLARGFVGHSAGAWGAPALARDNRETRLVHRRIRRAGQDRTGHRFDAGCAADAG
jgi:hypothetical protein